MKSDVRFEDTGVSDKALIVVSGWPDPNGLVSSVSNLADRHSFAKCDFVFTIDPLSCSGPVVGDSVMKYAESYAEKIKELNDEDILNIQDVLSKTQDTDVVEKFIELKSAEMIYQASIQVGAKLIQPTILDYIR